MKLDSHIVVFITGGGGDLIEALVKHILAKGCKVGLAGGKLEPLEKFQKAMGSDRLAVFKCDVTNEEDVKRAVEGTV